MEKNGEIIVFGESHDTRPQLERFNAVYQDMSLDHRLSLILDTVLNMYISVNYVLDYAEKLLTKKNRASKHRLEVELKTVEGFIDIIKEQLANEELKED